MKAAGDNRHGHRGATMILLAFRHGLRASEICALPGRPTGRQVPQQLLVLAKDFGDAADSDRTA